MVYCINPKCSHRENPDHAIKCQNCGTPLLVNNRYKLVKPLRELAGDYFTDIFLVEDMDLSPEEWGTQKVLKVLRYNNNDELVRLFKQESRTLMWLKKTSVPSVEPDGYFTTSITRPAQSLHCLVMEFIEGDNLEELVKNKGAIDEATALEWLTQVAEILHNLHQRKLAHRDIKPSNLILRPNGELVLIDFGTVGQEEWGTTKVGSPDYAAPEQLNGSAVLASDFFGLGRTFVYLLTGKVLVDLQRNKIDRKLVWRNHTRGISKELGDFIDDLMADQVNKRPENTVILQNRLRLIRHPEISRLRANYRRSIAGLSIVGITLFVTYLRPIAIGVNMVSGNNIHRLFQNIGTEKFQEKDLSTAKWLFNTALFFNPENKAAIYSLGRVCEQAEQINCAIDNYRQVILLNNYKEGERNLDAAAAAISSLTRLQILYQQPVDYNLIYQALSSNQEELPTGGSKVIKQPIIQASLYKNLGWAQLQSNQIADAEKYLKTAINLNPDRPAAYCLLAQVFEIKEQKQALAVQKDQQNLEIKKQESAALEPWKECSKRVNSNSSPEELQWLGIAQQRLAAADPNYKKIPIQPKDAK